MNIQIKPEIVCPHCKKLFTPRVKNQKYCGFECTRKVSMINFRKRKRLARMKRDLFS